MKPTLAAALKLLALTMLLFAMLSLPTAVFAAPAAAETSREVAALLSLLRGSTCRFERNGKWYDGERAAAHLQRKLDYATGRGRSPASSEQFIEEAATRSSFSGREYKVQCGDAVAMPARTWFLAALRQLRQ